MNNEIEPLSLYLILQTMMLAPCEMHTCHMFFIANLWHWIWLVISCCHSLTTVSTCSLPWYTWTYLAITLITCPSTCHTYTAFVRLASIHFSLLFHTNVLS